MTFVLIFTSCNLTTPKKPLVRTIVLWDTILNSKSINIKLHSRAISSNEINESIEVKIDKQKTITVNLLCGFGDFSNNLYTFNNDMAVLERKNIDLYKKYLLIPYQTCVCGWECQSYLCILNLETKKTIFLQKPNFTKNSILLGFVREKNEVFVLEIFDKNQIGMNKIELQNYEVTCDSFLYSSASKHNVSNNLLHFFSDSLVSNMIENY